MLASPEAFDESRRRVSTLLVRLNTNRSRESDIAELELSDTQPDGTAEHYLSLTSPPIPRRVTSLTWVTGRNERKRIAAAGSLDAIPDATREEIEAALPNMSFDAVGVYDVGQGNLNAALTACTPQAFFDFGGGCDANRATFP